MSSCWRWQRCPRSGQGAGWRIINLLVSLGFLGYGLYLAFFFTGGTYFIFFKVFFVPVLLLVNFLRTLATRRSAAPAMPSPGPMQQYPGSQPAVPAGPGAPVPARWRAAVPVGRHAALQGPGPAPRGGDSTAGLSHHGGRAAGAAAPAGQVRGRGRAISSISTAMPKGSSARSTAGQRFTVTGQVVRSGRTLTVCRGEAFTDGADMPFAIMQATMTAVYGRPGIQH